MQYLLIAMKLVYNNNNNNNNNNNRFTAQFVRDYPGEPVPEETLTHPPS